jgi:TrmH family RNA methyltransferase
MTQAQEIIRSRSNPLVRRFRELKDKGPREDVCLVEGPTLLEEALAAGLEIHEVAAHARFTRSDRGRRILGGLRARGIVPRLLDEAVLGALSEMETSQGVVALARPPRFDESALFRGLPLIVVAAALQNPGNLGALLRTAEAAGATGAFLTRETADPFSWKALRGSMGSAFRLPHVRGLSTDDALARLKAWGVAVVTAVVRDAPPPDALDLRRPVGFVLGREGSGLPDAIVAAADLRVAIPMADPVESLNVGVAAGILLFEARRQRRAAPGGRGTAGRFGPDPPSGIDGSAVGG